MKLLNASTKERQDIFRKIFATTPYYVLRDKLAKEAAALNREREAHRQSIAQYISGIETGPAGIETRPDEIEAGPAGIEVGPDNVLGLELRTLKENPGQVPVTDVLELLGKIIEADLKIKARLAGRHAFLRRFPHLPWTGTHVFMWPGTVDLWGRLW